MTRRAFLSPRRVPSLPDAAGFVPPAEPLARLLLGLAWRSHAFAGSLGHGLRRAPAGEPARRVARRIEAAVELSRAALAVAAGRPGGEELPSLVERRLAAEPMPWIESWAEACVADLLVGAVAAEAIDALRGSSDAGLASVAEGCDPGASAFGADGLAAMDADPGDRQCVQLLVDRWAPLALQCLGRPDSPVEPNLLEARIKTMSAAESLRRVLKSLREALEPHGLALPDAARMGLVLPDAS